MKKNKYLELNHQALIVPMFDMIKDHQYTIKVKADRTFSQPMNSYDNVIYLSENETDGSKYNYYIYDNKTCIHSGWICSGKVEVVKLRTRRVCCLL